MFNGLNKTIHGGEMVWRKTESKKFLDSVFFQTISPPCQAITNDKFSPDPFLKVFRTKVLDTH